MKKYLKFIFILIQPVLLAQNEADTLPVIYSWKLDNHFSQTVSTSMDTNLVNFQIFYPNYKYSISNSFLGNLGTATQSNIFSDRIYEDDVFFMNFYMPYFYSVPNTNYYNTRKQFSNLTYTFEKLSNGREESFDVFHTQNLSPKFNIGLGYNNISARGQYRFQKVKKNSFRLFGSYTSPKYTLYSSINLNYYRNNENGGVIDSIFESGRDSITVLIPTVFNGDAANNNSNAANRLRYFDILLSQRLKLFTLASKLDTADKSKSRNIAEPILTYVFRTTRSTRTYEDIDPVNPGLYDTWYFNMKETRDSIANFHVSNTLQLEFKTTFRRKVQVGLYGLAGYDFDKYYLYSEWDTNFNPLVDTIQTLIIEQGGDTLKGINRNEILHNTYVSAGIYGNFWSRVKANFMGTFYLVGEKSGQTEIRGLLNTSMKVFKRDYQFDIEGIVENKCPAYLLENYYSNNYMWKQELKYENGFRLSSTWRSPSKNFELRGNYYVLRNFIYFNEFAKPENYENILNYFSIETTKTFKLWKIYSINKIVYQVSENKNVLPLPDLVIYNSTFIDHTFRFKLTNGTLQAITGVDIYYNTSFNGYEYSPALSAFYVQNEKYIGNYPIMDWFLNIKLKRTRFFVKAMHFDSSWFEKRYYSTVHYPYNQNAIRFGLSWLFYN